MDNKGKILIMFVGKTHSGKTTLARKIEEKVKDLIILEADPIAVFMKEQFPKLREVDDAEHNGLFSNIALKFRTFLLFVEFTMALGKPIVLSNSNMWIKGRELVLELAKKFQYKTICVYFELPEELVLNRIEKSERSTNVLRITKDFKELIEKQKTRMQPPEASLFDEFFVIKSETETDQIEKKLIEKLWN